jgi:hypothetical protein
MATVQQNLRVIQRAVNETSVEAMIGRNRVVRNYYHRLSPSVQDNITFMHGTQTYRDKTLERFFSLITRRSLKNIRIPISFVGGDDNAFLAMAANDLSNQVYSQALKHRDSGAHLASLNMFIREVGGPALLNLQSGKVTDSILPDRAVISIVPVIEYANALEYHTMSGILYHVAQKFRRKYSRRLAVRYDYVGGGKIGAGGGSFPRIQIGFYGNLRSRIKRPGGSLRRRRR